MVLIQTLFFPTIDIDTQVQCQRWQRARCKSNAGTEGRDATTAVIAVIINIGADLKINRSQAGLAIQLKTALAQWQDTHRTNGKRFVITFNISIVQGIFVTAQVAPTRFDCQVFEEAITTENLQTLVTVIEAAAIANTVVVEIAVVIAGPD